jgi:hypothetical protein
MSASLTIRVVVMLVGEFAATMPLPIQMTTLPHSQFIR